MNDRLVSPGIARLLALPPEARIKAIRSLPRRARRKLPFEWKFWARTDQLWKPTHHTFTAYVAGRGWGKTRVGAEAVRCVAEHPELAGGRERRGPGDKTWGEGAVIGIAGRTANDVNQTMLYGESGIMRVSPPWFRPRHYKSDKLLVWPNGAVGRLMSGDVPDSFRGPNFGFLWADELPHWVRAKASWDTALLALRHGQMPRAIVTTTPLGTQEVVELLYLTDDAGAPIPDPEAVDGYAENPATRIVRGSTYDNAANLAETFIHQTVTKYEGSDLGEQELHGRVILTVPGALWKQDWFRRCEVADLPEFRTVVIAVDPAVTKTRASAETGIIAAALGVDDKIYILADGSGHYSPEEWARKVLQFAHAFQADRIVEEDNNGGELVAANLRHHDHTLDIHPVRAHKSKERRARMVLRAWEMGHVVHVGDSRRWRHLEWQLTHYDPSKPEKDQRLDRMDAVVWAAIHLLGGGDDLKALRGLGNVDAWAAVREHLGDARPRRKRKRRSPSPGAYEIG